MSKQKDTKVDLGKGYIEKPKPVEGYDIERYYCECGCKSGYWHYVKKVQLKHKTMTLPKLLSGLSKNKNIAIECNCCDGKLTIKILESFYFTELMKEEVNIEGRIDVTKFTPYLKK